MIYNFIELFLTNILIVTVAVHFKLEYIFLILSLHTPQHIHGLHCRYFKKIKIDQSAKNRNNVYADILTACIQNGRTIPSELLRMEEWLRIELYKYNALNMICLCNNWSVFRLGSHLESVTITD